MAIYAGDADVSTTWGRLTSEANSLLVDVRTTAEWTFVGIPDLSSINKEIILVPWQEFPAMSVNPSFAAQVAEKVKQQGGSEETEIFFLCRSGVRSQAAANALTEMGFSKCFNVSGGFEGPANEAQHRGMLDGWKAKGLPWRQN